MAEAWIKKLSSSQKTCIVQDNKRKVHFTFSDGAELIEEYDVNTDELLLRKWRKKGTLGNVGKWEIEVGEQSSSLNFEIDGLVESNANPVFIRKDTKSHFQWRIRNLPYPLENYKIVTKPQEGQIVLSTVNKKYFKMFGVPDLTRYGLPLQQDVIEMAHANNTLIISYKKPAAYVEFEKRLLQEIKRLKASKDGDVDCATS
ncbi:protein DPCD [Biomphalaria glabrata]|uniref:Protein DPCD n=1 Tax=Biomphalaria glabrata TaxID=6526 RepID=A0A9U8ENW5_BIOGL|nr:protein DPCD-like isoform X2 [Biomphalaria glabrata]KAI8770285.1 protein DPCD-like [Biomphalaria glabrata]